MCSWQPSCGRALFWLGDMSSFSMAIVDTRVERRDIRSLYRHDIRAIGRKLAGSSAVPFLCIRMVVASFH